MATIVSTSNSSYSVKWESEGTLFLKEIRSVLSNTKVFPTDMTIACEGRLFSAHKLLLAICSSNFRELIEKNFAHFPNAVIVLSDVSAVSMNYILKFIYKGRVDVEENFAIKFFEEAHSLKIKGLMKKDITFTRHLGRPVASVDLLEEMNFSVPPATPGRSISHLEKQTKHPTMEKQPSSTLFLFSTVPKTKAAFERNTSKGETKDSKEKNQKPNHKTEIAKSDISKVDVTPDDIEKLKFVPPKLSSNKNDIDCDSDSSGNLFHCEDNYVSPADDDSDVEDVHKDPEVIVIDDEVEKEEAKHERPCTSSSLQTPSSIPIKVTIFDCKKKSSTSKSSSHKSSSKKSYKKNRITETKEKEAETRKEPSIVGNKEAKPSAKSSSSSTNKKRKLK